LFSRVGSYTKPIELQVEVLHTGRTWGSDTITAFQDDRVFGRGQVFTRDGELVAEFSQDAMAKSAEREMDWQHAM